MKHTLKNQAKLAGIALAVVAAFAALGTGAAQAATFTKADISVVPRGEGQGGLLCSFVETGLGAYSSITYSCGATDVGVLSGCFVKNKLVANSVGPVSVFHNVTAHEAEALLAKNNGTIRGSLTTEIPESEGGETCTEPAEAGVVAVRWCGATLVDTTTPLVGAGPLEVFQQFNATTTIPDCATLATMPGTGGGE